MKNGEQNTQLLEALRIKDKDISKTIPIAILSHWPSILCILAITILLSIDSGKDLLVGLLDTNKPIQIFGRTAMLFFALIIYSSSIWLRPFVLYRKRHYESWFHRTLSILPCLILGAAILRTQFKLDLLTALNIYWGLVLLLVIFLGSIFYRKFLYDYINIWQSTFIFFITIVALVTAIYINKAEGTEDVILSYHLFGTAIAVLGVGLFHFYKKIDLDLLKKRSSDPKIVQFYLGYYYLIAFSIGLLIAVFTFFDHIHIFHPIFVFLCSFAFYTVIFNLLSSFYDMNSYRKTLIKNLIFLLVVFVVAIGFAFPNFQHHKVDMVKYNQPYDRINVDDHIQGWLKKKVPRYIQNNPDKKFPIWLISGEGGGSRAGFWFTRCMLAIDSMNNFQFKDHIYAMSTVSGSSVGGAALLSYWDYHQNSPSKMKQQVSSSMARNIFHNNYLSSAIYSILIRDFVKQLFPFRPWVGEEDRNYWLQQEEAFFIQHALENQGKEDPYKFFRQSLPQKEDNHFQVFKPYLSYYYDSTGQYNYDFPILLSNATLVQKGKRALVSPLKFDDRDFVDAFDINQFIEKEYPGETLTLGEAANLSELFPFFSATAVLGDSIALGDGGYFENLGLTAIYELKRKIEDQLKFSGYENLVEIKVLVIRNSTYKQKMKRRLKVRNQIYAPLDALYNSGIGGRTEYMFKYTKMKMGNNFYVLDLPHESGQNEKLLLPLNRYLSENAIQTMEDLFQQKNLQNYQLNR